MSKYGIPDAYFHPKKDKLILALAKDNKYFDDSSPWSPNFKKKKTKPFS